MVRMAKTDSPYVMRSLYVGFAENAILVCFIGNSSGSDNNTVTPLMRKMWGCGTSGKKGVLHPGRRFGFCAIIAFVAYLAVLCTVGRASAAGYTCFGRVELSRAFIRRPLHFCFSGWRPKYFRLRDSYVVSRRWWKVSITPLNAVTPIVRLAAYLVLPDPSESLVNVLWTSQRELIQLCFEQTL